MKVVCSTDFSGARRRPSTTSPTHSVYCPPLTFSVVAYFKLPPNRVVELGTQVEL